MGKITKNIFLVDNDSDLEESGLYRFLRVLNFIGYGFVLLIVLFAYLFFINATTYKGQTLICPDGSRWNDPYLTSADKCGLCYHRTGKNNYTSCDYSDSHYNDYYQVVDVTPRTYTDRQAWMYSAFIGLVGLAVLKLLVNTTIYVTSGKKPEKILN